MDLPIVVTLTRPVVVGDQTYDKLSFDEPDLASQIDYAELEATFSNPPTPVDATRVNRFWISRLSEIPEAVAGKIKESDIEAVNAAVEQILKPIQDKRLGGDTAGSEGNEPPAK